MNTTTWIGFCAVDSEKRSLIQTGNFPIYITSSGYRWVVAMFDKKIYMVPIKCVAFKEPFDEKPVLVPLHELAFFESNQEAVLWTLEGPQKELNLSDKRWKWTRFGPVFYMIEQYPQNDIPAEFSHIPVLDVSGSALGHHLTGHEDPFIQVQG